MKWADRPAPDQVLDTRCNGRPTESLLVSPKIPKSTPQAEPARRLSSRVSASFSAVAGHPRAFATTPLVLDPPPDSLHNPHRNATAQGLLIEPRAPIEQSGAEWALRRDAARRCTNRRRSPARAG